MFKYGIVLYWSNDDGAFIAETPGTSGLHGARSHAGDGAPGDRGAMRLRIETARVRGEPAPEPKGERPMRA